MTEYKAYTIYCEAMVAKAQTSVLLNGDFASGARAIPWWWSPKQPPSSAR